MENVKKVGLGALLGIVLLLGSIYGVYRYYKVQWVPHVETSVVTENPRRKFKMDWVTVTVYVTYDIPRKPNILYLPTERFAGKKKVIDYDCPTNMVEKTTKQAREWLSTEGGIKLIQKVINGNETN